MTLQLLSEVKNQEKHKLPRYFAEDNRKFTIIYLFFKKENTKDLTTCQVVITSNGETDG